jgi:hypothetical protein
LVWIVKAFASSPRTEVLSLDIVAKAINIREYIVLFLGPTSSLTYL